MFSKMNSKKTNKIYVTLTNFLLIFRKFHILILTNIFKTKPKHFLNLWKTWKISEQQNSKFRKIQPEHKPNTLGNRVDLKRALSRSLAYFFLRPVSF
jgi:hypothetical protein